ncbi:hypothetical protein [Candidatus Nitrosotalea okcheonensis]|uniref:Uncharacterized protein n=1 Tax=Candidatus Nitrosotalea okcheonensis TaxID=1903276 RepID=A0A2H1FI09_9ARCH|nr:hypothetical protein [Candidatus Nitrosotalea okcheonensis]SMH72410.1 protein of unknown function [Candidatus Nitrosotalea okcheonensis]
MAEKVRYDLKQIHMQIKYLAAILSVILLFGGLYLMFLYDVPDTEMATNTWVSLTLIIAGIAGIIVSLLWKKRNPLIDDTDHNDDTEDEGKR